MRDKLGVLTQEVGGSGGGGRLLLSCCCRCRCRCRWGGGWCSYIYGGTVLLHEASMMRLHQFDPVCVCGTRPPLPSPPSTHPPTHPPTLPPIHPPAGEEGGGGRAAQAGGGRAPGAGGAGLPPAWRFFAAIPPSAELSWHPPAPVVPSAELAPASASTLLLAAAATTCALASPPHPTLPHPASCQPCRLANQLPSLSVFPITAALYQTNLSSSPIAAAGPPEGGGGG